MVIKRKKYFAILQTLGASLWQMITIVLCQGLGISCTAFIEAMIVLKELFIFANQLIQKSISDLIDEFFVIQNNVLLGVFIGVLILTLLCCLIPIKKVKQIEIIEALKS